MDSKQYLEELRLLGEEVQQLEEKNCPTNPSKWSYYKSQAKQKFDVYPSAYANGWASKQYKAAGGGWKQCAGESMENTNENFAVHMMVAKAIADQKVKNPETKKDVRVTTALKDKQHPAHGKAKSLVQRLKDKFSKKESVNEGYGDWIKAKNLTDIVKLSKQKKNATFYVTDDNNSRIGSFYLKNGKFAKATTANPSYDLSNNKTTLKDRSDVIYKYKVDESVNETITEVEMGDMGYVEKHKSIATVYGVMSGGKKVKVKLGKTGKVVVIDAKDIQILPESVNEETLQEAPTRRSNDFFNDSKHGKAIYKLLGGRPFKVSPVKKYLDTIMDKLGNQKGIHVWDFIGKDLGLDVRKYGAKPVRQYEFALLHAIDDLYHIHIKESVNEISYDSQGNLKAKKQYKSLSDYEKVAKKGDFIWIGQNPKDFQGVDKALLYKVVDKDSEGNAVLASFNKKGKYTIPQKNQVVVVVEGVVNEGKFKVDDLVYNKRTKTVGIVRMGDDKYGEVKTDADGNVSVDELEKYNPIKFKHQTKAKVAPSTEKEVNSRGLFNPFKAESVNEVASRTAMEIGGLTGMNKDAIQKFVDDNKLDIEKVYQYVKNGKLPERMALVSAIAGKPGNTVQTKLIKKFK